MHENRPLENARRPLSNAVRPSATAGRNFDIGNTVQMGIFDMPDDDDGLKTV